MKRALISVYEKRGIESFARGLQEAGWELYSTGGTYRFLAGEGIKVKKLEELTGFEKLLGGRVKTLHPAVFAGILARRDSDAREMERMGFPSFDLVVVNLYPFTDAVKKGLDGEELIEMIDIGGVALIRAAAKNHRWVTVVTHPEDYLPVLEEIQKYGHTSPETRKRLAAKAFALTSFYDASIFWTFNQEKLPAFFPANFAKYQDLRYGENPHQEAAFYVSPFSLWREMVVLQGKKLSFNNIADLAAAWEMAMDFEETFCAIFKHQNPCGAALGETPAEAYRKALEGDPQSAFGGIVALNREVDVETAEEMKKTFLEVIVAPSFSAEAREILKKKKNLRLVQIPFQRRYPYEGRLVEGGMLVQERDSFTEEDFRIDWVVKPEPVPWQDIRLAIKIAKALKSNSAALAKEGMMVGGCGGQTSRVEAVRIACSRAGERARDAVLASDGFFPFPDSIEVAHSHGVAVVVAPGGSRRDPEVAARARELGIGFGFISRRHFRH